MRGPPSGGVLHGLCMVCLTAACEPRRPPGCGVIPPDAPEIEEYRAEHEEAGHR